LKSGNWSQDEQPEPERFCRANTISNGGPEFFIIDDREDALKLAGSVGTVGSGVLVTVSAPREPFACEQPALGLRVPGIKLVIQAREREFVGVFFALAQLTENKALGGFS
jgi:hypothetical protein